MIVYVVKKPGVDGTLYYDFTVNRFLPMQLLEGTRLTLNDTEANWVKALDVSLEAEVVADTLMSLGNVPKEDATNLTRMGYVIGSTVAQDGLTAEQAQRKGLVGLYYLKNEEEEKRSRGNNYGED